MSELRERISAAREAYRSLRCPIDLAACVPVAGPRMGRVRMGLASAIAAVVAMALFIRSDAPRAPLPRASAPMVVQEKISQEQLLAVIQSIQIGIFPTASGYIDHIPVELKSLFQTLREKTPANHSQDPHDEGACGDGDFQYV